MVSWCEGRDVASEKTLGGITKSIGIGMLKILGLLVISYLATIALEVSTGLSTPGAWLAHRLIARGWFKSPWPLGYYLDVAFWSDLLLILVIVVVVYAAWSCSHRKGIVQEAGTNGN